MFLQASQLEGGKKEANLNVKSHEVTLDLLMLRVSWRMRVLHVASRALRGIRAGHRAVLLGYEPGTGARLRLNKATTDTKDYLSGHSRQLIP